MSITNGYIEKTGFKIFQKFLGCFPADLQPKTRRTNFSIVFNLSKHNEKGTHFVAIYTDKEKLIYFDSFGEPIMNNLIQNFVNKHLKEKKIVFNKTKIQHDLSSFCGIFCLSFLAAQENQIPLKEYLNNFDKTDLMLNDKISTNVLKSLIYYRNKNN